MSRPGDQKLGAFRPFLAMIAGALLPLSFAPFNVWPALLLGLGIAFWLFKDVVGWREGFRLGWLIGVGKYALGASWIYVSIHEQGGASESLAGILVGVFVAGMALFSGLFGLIFGLINTASSPRWYLIGLFASSWVLAEWSLTWLLTGFPWLFAGYGLMTTWLAAYAPVVGVLGLSFLSCVLAGFLAETIPDLRGRLPGSLIVFGVIVAGGFGLKKIDWVSLGEVRRVALVQGNIEQITKWDADRVRPIIDTYQQLTEPHWEKDLIIWPEAAITLFVEQAAPLLSRWDNRGQSQQATLVLGVPDAERLDDGSLSFQNTAMAVGDGSGRYVKRRLVPFGEYVPAESLLRGLISFFDLPMSRSGSGPEEQPPIRAGDLNLGLAICYEIAYPELVRVSAQASDVLVTISNDAWFGASIGPHQHLQLAQMRALENGRYVLRSTNNGVTAIIDERGRITAKLPQFEASVLSGDFYAAKGRTPFNRLGHGPVLVLAFGLLASGILRGKRGGILRNA